MNNDVMIGCPVRNRDWIIKKYLSHLMNLEYPKKKIALSFLVNDSEDNTLDEIEKFKKNNINKYKDIRIREINTGVIKDRRISNVRKEIYKHLALMRNDFLDMRVDEDYVFSVDSDILISKKSLKKLIKSDKDIISALIWNNKKKTAPNIMKFDKRTDRGNKYVHIRDFEKGIFQVDVTGACYLLKSKVSKNIKYSWHFQGEDIGFCENAKKSGFEVWTNTSIECNHIMNKNS